MKTPVKFMTIIPLDEVNQTLVDRHYQAPEPAYNTSVVEIIEFMGGMPLKDQVYMLCNTLTIAGYTQKEIAETLKVPHQTYRNRLLEIRGNFRDRDIKEL